MQPVLACTRSCRHEQVENAKREMRKEQALKKAFDTGKEGEEGSSSEEDAYDADEDKLAEEQEAGMALLSIHVCILPLENLPHCACVLPCRAAVGCLATDWFSPYKAFASFSPCVQAV